MGLLWLQNRERTRSMPYPKSKDKITLEAVGCPEYWVEFHLLSGMKFNDVKKFFGDSLEDDKTDTEYINEMLEKMVIDWNLPEEDGGEVLPIPSVDKSSVGKLPNVIVTHLISIMSGTDVEGEEIENLD